MNQQELFPKPERSVDQMIRDGLSVINSAIDAGAREVIPLYSGGHDSISATWIAAQHPKFDGNVYHIDTGIGSRSTRELVHDVANEEGWTLRVFKSSATYDRFVSKLGFPTPGSHQWVYNWLKDRCVSAIAKGRGRIALITGCRSHESVRRMGHVEPLKIGETSKKTGIVRRKARAWTAPCHDWTSADQKRFMDALALPRNPLKDSPLAMSGECFCGAFARPNEIELIRCYAPDVAQEIDRLAKLAPEGRNVWGVRGKNERGVVKAETGPLCSSCDYKARAAGLLFTEADTCAL